MNTSITDKMAVVFNVDELCFVPEFYDLYNRYGDGGFYYMILYAHPQSPYSYVDRKKERFQAIITDTQRRYSTNDYKKMGLDKIDIEECMGAEMSAAIKKYVSLLPKTSPSVVISIYQQQLAKIMQELTDLNLSDVALVKDVAAYVKMEKDISKRITEIQKEVDKIYMTNQKTGVASALIQEIKNMQNLSNKKR